MTHLLLKKNLSKVLLTPVIWRSPAIRKKVPQDADSTLTWYGNTTAWSLWGMPAIRRQTISASKGRGGGRSRYNLTDQNYIFGQASWLTDRYNGYQQRDVFTAGYGHRL